MNPKKENDKLQKELYTQLIISYLNIGDISIGTKIHKNNKTKPQLLSSAFKVLEDAR